MVCADVGPEVGPWVGLPSPLPPGRFHSRFDAFKSGYGPWPQN